MLTRKARDLLNILRTGGHCSILSGIMQFFLLHNNWANFIECHKAILRNQIALKQTTYFSFIKLQERDPGESGRQDGHALHRRPRGGHRRRPARHLGPEQGRPGHQGPGVHHQVHRAQPLQSVSGEFLRINWHKNCTTHFPTAKINQRIARK